MVVVVAAVCGGGARRRLDRCGRQTGQFPARATSPTSVPHAVAGAFPGLNLHQHAGRGEGKGRGGWWASTARIVHRRGGRIPASECVAEAASERHNLLGKMDRDTLAVAAACQCFGGDVSYSPAMNGVSIISAQVLCQLFDARVDPRILPPRRGAEGSICQTNRTEIAKRARERASTPRTRGLRALGLEDRGVSPILRRRHELPRSCHLSCPLPPAHTSSR